MCASFLLIAGFMRLVGKIAWWKSLLTALVFTAVMFVTFEIAFTSLCQRARSKRRSAAKPPVTLIGDGSHVMEASSLLAHAPALSGSPAAR